MSSCPSLPIFLESSVEGGGDDHGTDRQAGWMGSRYWVRGKRREPVVDYGEAAAVLTRRRAILTMA